MSTQIEKSRKELMRLKVSDLTEDERKNLSNLGLNCCDVCGAIDLSEDLYWIDGEQFFEDKDCIELVKQGICAICNDCFDNKLFNGRE